jgi:hypothetical protein
MHIDMERERRDKTLYMVGLFKRTREMWKRKRE